ncbi:uncharacterized protein BKA78DRAFT_175171 [Phyllosticta capitalensis]|uniref:uncharacterized protein n=1 Tax=Phyllosticta capitalensis TaxID=121624 RepID=UPI003131418E
MPVVVPAVAEALRTAVSHPTHSPTQGTRLLLSPCVFCTPCILQTGFPGSRPHACISSFTGFAPNRWACSRLLLFSPGLVFGRTSSSKGGAPRWPPHLPACLSQSVFPLAHSTPQIQVVIVVAVRPPPPKSHPHRNHPRGVPTCIHHWSILHIDMRAHFWLVGWFRLSVCPFVRALKP